MLYERYHIPTTPAPPRHTVIGKFKVIRDEELCRNCGRCSEACIYGVHERKNDETRSMAEPLSHLCRNCFRCMQKCPTHALQMIMNPEYRALGDDYWEPHRLWTIWYEAENGRIPVFGAGFRGPFDGPWFDGMWTDMSEIVRPTRDGIHGREYISTAVDIGRKPPFIEFDKRGEIVSEITKVLEIQLPIIFDLLPMETFGERMTSIVSRAAAWLGALCVAPLEHADKIPTQERTNFVPVVGDRIRQADIDALKEASMVEVEYGDRFEELLSEVRMHNPEALTAARLPLNPDLPELLVGISELKIDAAHITADYWGLEKGTEQPRHLRYALREAHQSLMEQSMRDELSLIVSGGIAAAEHVPKAIILGADAVAIDRVLMIALGCRLCGSCTAPQICPVDIMQADFGWGVQRIVNVMGAWRDQLLEVMGAMGIRDVRRLRGELGRSMFSEDIEREVFAPLFEGGREE